MCSLLAQHNSKDGPPVVGWNIAISQPYVSQLLLPPLLLPTELQPSRPCLALPEQTLGGAKPLLLVPPPPSLALLLCAVVLLDSDQSSFHNTLGQFQPSSLNNQHTHRRTHNTRTRQIRPKLASQPARLTAWPRQPNYEANLRLRAHTNSYRSKRSARAWPPPITGLGG